MPLSFKDRFPSVCGQHALNPTRRVRLIHRHQIRSAGLILPLRKLTENLKRVDSFKKLCASYYHILRFDDPTPRFLLQMHVTAVRQIFWKIDSKNPFLGTSNVVRFVKQTKRFVLVLTAARQPLQASSGGKILRT